MSLEAYKIALRYLEHAAGDAWIQYAIAYKWKLAAWGQDE